MTARELIGALLFAGIVLVAARVVRWLVSAAVDYDPHCVYEFDLIDGRIYVGYGRDPQARSKTHRDYQRNLPEGHARRWWPLVPAEVRETLMPPRVTWYRSEAMAREEEQSRIRRYVDQGKLLANVIKYKGGVPV